MTARVHHSDGEIRLRWWTLALPAAAFAALLMLLATGTEAEAASGWQPLAQLADQLWSLLP